MKPAESKPYLKIGDAARLVGVSPSVIRSWESLGLTRPQRTASKYRLYSPQDIRLLKRARFLRRVRGLNAPAIVEMLKRDGLVQASGDNSGAAIGAHLCRIKPKAGSGESYTHEGEEFLFVLRGALRIALQDQEYRLKPGDSFYFESATPHRWTNPGRSETWVLWVNTPPTF